MHAVKVGDRVWCQFVTADHGPPRAWVYSMVVEHITDDGELLCYDEGTRKTRMICHAIENVSRSESEAWRGCELALQRIASEVLQLAGECRQKAKGVTYVVA